MAGGAAAGRLTLTRIAQRKLHYRPMAASKKSIFLSHASQDVDASRRIRETLRVAGLEVWFDESELRGGDAWDVSIRRQIQECALFMPLISANTAARSEGYFRLEWKLAVDCSHLVADDRTFLLPVVIDASPEAAARVPDRFRERHWMRLLGGKTPPEFTARVRNIVGDESSSAPPATASWRSNLPTSTTPPVGRERELAEIVALLRRQDVRCVTLTGPGGTGKTRLALAAAEALVGDHRDGVCFIPLATITDRSLVMAQVAKALDVNESAGQDLQAYLATKRLLLVVDNVEQVLDAAVDLARLLTRAPQVQLLTTGREALRVAAERVYPIATGFVHARFRPRGRWRDTPDSLQRASRCSTKPSISGACLGASAKPGRRSSTGAGPASSSTISRTVAAAWRRASRSAVA